MENCGYKFVCGEPDYYNCSAFQKGEHYVDYNSAHATLYYVGTEDNYSSLKTTIKLVANSDEAYVAGKAVEYGAKAYAGGGV